MSDDDFSNIRTSDATLNEARSEENSSETEASESSGTDDSNETETEDSSAGSSELSHPDVFLAAFNRLGYLHPCKASIRNIDYQGTVSVPCWHIFL